MPNAEAESGLHPARPRVERREARGEEDAARPGSFRWESTAGSCYEVGGRKTQLGQGLHWVTSGLGKLRGREAASLRRDRKPARVEATAQLSEAEPQAHRTGRSAGPVCNRQAHSDQGVEDEAQGALRLGVQRKKRSTPTAERVQREKRSTPTTGRCPTGEGLITPTAGRVQREKGLSLQPAGRGRERRAYHSVHRPALPAKGLITPHWQHSLVGDSTVMPVQEGSRTQVSRAGNSGKA